VKNVFSKLSKLLFKLMTTTTTLKEDF